MVVRDGGSPINACRVHIVSVSPCFHHLSASCLHLQPSITLDSRVTLSTETSWKPLLDVFSLGYYLTLYMLLYSPYKLFTFLSSLKDQKFLEDSDGDDGCFTCALNIQQFPGTQEPFVFKAVIITFSLNTATQSSCAPMIQVEKLRR